MTKAAHIDVASAVSLEFASADPAACIPAGETRQDAILPPAPARSAPAIIACGASLLAAVTAMTAAVLAGQAAGRADVAITRMESDRVAPPTQPGPARADMAAAAHDAALASHPVTEAQLRTALSELRGDIVRLGDASRAGMPLLKDGHAEIANRLSLVLEKLNRLEASGR